MLRPLLVVLLAAVPAFARPGPPKFDPDRFAELVQLLHTETVQFDGPLKGLTLGQLLESLTAQFGKRVRFVVREDLFRQLGPDFEDIKSKKFYDDRNYSGISLSDVLRVSLLDIKSGFLVRKNSIEILPIDDLWEEFDANERPPLRDEDGCLRDLPLIPLVSELFKDKPLADALDDLSKHYDRTIVLSGHTPEQAKTPVTARLMNVPLPLAVRMLARNADLHVVESGQTLIVTTEKEAKLFRPKPVKAKPVEK